MSGQIVPFAQAGGLPAHIAAAFGEDEGNTAGHASIDQLSYRGKVWRAVLKGQEHPLTKTDPDSGEINPMQTVSVVVLDFNKKRSRSYYPDNYVEGKNAVPLCSSFDGVTPDAGVKSPQSSTCATCPHSVKGSKMTAAGKPTTACAPFKRVAVVPVSDTRPEALAKHALLLLKLAQTSVWDKDTENAPDGWYAFDQYIDMLRARGAKHSCMVETRIKFDSATAYPKLLFSARRWLDASEIITAKARLADEEDKATITTILEGRGNDGVSGHPVDPTDSLGSVQTAVTAVNQALANTQVQAQAAQALVNAQAVADIASNAMEELADMASKVAATEPAAPKAPPKAPAKVAPPAPAWPPEGWTQHPSDPAYWYNAEDEVITEAELRARVAPPAAPAVPKIPKAPAKKTAAKAVEKVKAEAVEDAFGSAEATAPAAAAAATPVAETAVQAGTPVELKSLLDGWDDN
jgi:hypothetical protein